MATKKLTALTEAQKERMTSFAQEWIQYGWRTQPLTEEEWAVWEAGARKCYEFAGIPWPNMVVRVSSPIVGGFAAPLAVNAIAAFRKTAPIKGSAVYSAVDSAVYSAVDSDKLVWHYWLGGRQWCWWPAFIAYFRDIVQLKLEGDIWERSKAYEDAMSAGYWWPNRDFVMVCDTPSVLHVESAAGQHRMHCETGPAVAWADGWGIYSWHGTQVPTDLIENGWDVERIMAERNTEVRRCAIERMGWNRFVIAAGLKLADESPDPGNPGQSLRLYDVPRDVLEWPVRVLVAHNATRERDGSRHTFGLTVPTDCKTAISASAWTFGLTEREYAGLARAT